MPMVDCSACHGIGSDQVAKCQACNGYGQVWIREEDEEEDTDD